MSVDYLEQHPPAGSAEQHFFSEQGLLQSEAPPQAHELRASEDNATTDTNDSLWITFFIDYILLFCCELTSIDDESLG